MLNISLPKPYATRIRNALDASANSVNLRNLGGGGGAFYAAGTRIEEMYVFVFLGGSSSSLAFSSWIYSSKNTRLVHILTL